MADDVQATTIQERLRAAFDGNDVAQKNIALRQAHDEIERLQAALRKIAARGTAWPERDEGFGPMALVIAREAVPEGRHV